MESMMLCNSIPPKTPTNRQTIIKEINELSLTTAIRINNNTIPDNTMSNGI
jgi:hypothetical protein